MRKVIVNSTPLIVLSGIGYLDILQKLYGEILIPTAVYQEVTKVKDSACIQMMNGNEWIHVMQIQNDIEKKMYKAKLHAGEVEVMILAQEQKADLVIIDDNAAKKTAKYYDNNKFQKFAATGMQLGSIVLMILALLL